MKKISQVTVRGDKNDKVREVKVSSGRLGRLRRQHQVSGSTRKVGVGSCGKCRRLREQATMQGRQESAGVRSGNPETGSSSWLQHRAGANTRKVLVGLMCETTVVIALSRMMERWGRVLVGCCIGDGSGRWMSIAKGCCWWWHLNILGAEEHFSLGSVLTCKFSVHG